MTERIVFNRGRKEEGAQLVFIDIKRAYLQVDAKRDIYVELLEEDREEGTCAKLVKAMYGTRDAAHNWACTYKDAYREFGFVVGRASPCVMHHPKRHLIGSGHG